MAAVRSPAGLLEEHGLRLERCTVSLWRGYVTARFYAHLADGLVVAESGPFRWRKAAAPPDAGAARAAHDGLVVELQAAGWTALTEGAAWFETTFGQYVLPVGPSPPPEIARPPRPAPELPSPRPLATQAERPKVTQPAPATPAAAAATPVPPHTRRGRLIGLTGALLVGAIAIAVGVAGGTTAQTAPAARHHPATQHTHAGVATTQPGPAAASSAVALRIAGIGSGSWLQVRRGSSTGAQLYNGVLTDGKSVEFTGARLWAQFGAAGNLAITLDGKRLPYNGTIEHTFRARRPAR